MDTTRELINGFKMKTKKEGIEVIYMSFGSEVKRENYKTDNVKSRREVKEKLMDDTLHNLNLNLYPEESPITLKEIDNHVKAVLSK